MYKDLKCIPVDISFIEYANIVSIEIILRYLFIEQCQ